MNNDQLKSNLRITPTEAFDGVEPKLGEKVFIHSTAAIIGQVILGDRVNIWPQVTLRGDEGMIKIGEDSNIQDGSTIHMTGGYSETMIGARVTVGHMCLLHGCTVGDDCLIGMGTILLDNCEIGSGSYVAAGTMITGGKTIPPNSFVMGRPGNLVIKPISDLRAQEKAYSWRHYVKLAAQYLTKQNLGPILSLAMLGPLLSLLVACHHLVPNEKIDSRLLIKQNHVTIATLKQQHLYDYTPFVRTEYDPFSHQREVINVTKSAPITINYKSFSAPKFDYVVQRSHSLYGQYRFAQNATKRFRGALINIYGDEVLEKNIDELQTLFNDNEEGDEAELPKILIAGAKATRLAIAGHKDLVQRAMRSKSQLNSWRNLVAQDMQENINIAHYEQEMSVAVKRAHTALNEVMGGAPFLSKAMKEVSAAAAAIR